MKSIQQRLIESPIAACISGALILWVSFGIRQSFGVFLIPITTETGWDRSTFSIAVALYQLLWGFAQPFLVYLAERKFGFGKVIFISCLVYAVGCFMLYAANRSVGVLVAGMGILVGVSAGGNSFPNILASVGRRFSARSKYQSIAFGIVSSFGSFGQACFLPIARSLLTTVGWKMTMVIFGIIMVGLSPLSYFLQTIPPRSLVEEKEEVFIDEGKVNMESGKEIVMNKSEDSSIKESEKPIEDISAPDIKTALKEAFTHPTFIFITMGFSVCGFHIAFLATHFPAYLQDQGVSASIAAWTLSILGLCSMFGTIATGYLANIISPRYILMGIYGIRAVFIAIVVFVPLSMATIMIFSVFFGFLWLSTVPPTTKFVSEVFGQKYLGTLTSITFVGHQIGSFLGAYVAGIIYDQSHDYRRMWYGSIAVAVFGVVCNFFAFVEPINERRIKKSNQKLAKLNTKI